MIIRCQTVNAGIRTVIGGTHIMIVVEGCRYEPGQARAKARAAELGSGPWLWRIFLPTPQPPAGFQKISCA